jgi:hypothetical protein
LTTFGAQAAHALVEKAGPELTPVLNALAGSALTVEVCDRELERLRYKLAHLDECRLCQRRVELDLIAGTQGLRDQIDRWLDVRHELAKAAA